MRYEYRGNITRPTPVRFVRHDGVVTTNPPDALVDKLKAGYPMMETDQPEYDMETQMVRPDYVLRDGTIYKEWRIEALDPEEEPESELEARVSALEAENVALKAALDSAIQ